MAALIEDQMHRFLIQQEEERCAALEAQYQQSEATRGMKVKRRTIPKPWKRPSEEALCQDMDLLVMVQEYSYDLSNQAFRQYCDDRGILNVAGKPTSEWWKFADDYSKNKRDFLAAPSFHFAQEVNGSRYRYTAGELETAWLIMVLGRAKLQDCWELFSRKHHHRER